MALQMSYTDEYDDVHETSYWLVGNIHIEKRLNDNTLTPVSVEDMPDFVKYAGYYGIIVLMGWRTKADRDAGKNPRWVHSVYPTGFDTFNTPVQVTTSENYRFTIDPDLPLYDQAYQHVLSLDLFSTAENI